MHGTKENAPASFRPEPVVVGRNCNNRSGRLTPQEGRDIKMVVPTVAPAQQAPGDHACPGPEAPDGGRIPIPARRTADLLRGTLRWRLAIGQRRHRRTGGAGGDRRLSLLVAAAEADIGEALQQRQALLLRRLFLSLAAGLAKLGSGPASAVPRYAASAAPGPAYARLPAG